MLSYCLKCSKSAENKNPKVVGTKDGRIMLLLKCECVTVKNQDLSKSKKLMDH